MRRRSRPDNIAQPRSDERYRWSRAQTSDKTWYISPWSAAVLVVLTALTVLNVLAVQRWYRSKGGSGWGVGDAIEVLQTLALLIKFKLNEFHGSL